jgi:2,5-diamino-6-(ribosylamino)-4(3H)-pyrimidinone 5'-phosphate reductase
MNIVVNAAMSADGKLSSRRREQIAISGSEDFERVDALRADSDAVMVGVGTVLADDPHLTLGDATSAARKKRGDLPYPTRVVADSRARTPLDARILDNTAQTTLIVSEAAPTERVERLKERGAAIITVGTERVDLSEGLSKLDSETNQLMVEGGGELIFSLFDAQLVDELSVFVGPTIIGGREAPTLADGKGFVEGFPKLSLESIERLDEGALLRWRVQ